MSLFAARPTSVDIIFRTFAIFPSDLSFIFRILVMFAIVHRVCPQSNQEVILRVKISRFGEKVKFENLSSTFELSRGN